MNGTESAGRACPGESWHSGADGEPNSTRFFSLQDVRRRSLKRMWWRSARVAFQRGMPSSEAEAADRSPSPIGGPPGTSGTS